MARWDSGSDFAAYHNLAMRARIEQKAAAAEAAARAERLETEHLLRAMHTGDLAAYERWFVRECARHHITIAWQPADVRNLWSYADRRLIGCRHFRTEDDVAGGLHELCHVLNGLCPNVQPHYLDPANTRQRACLACEREVSTRALRLPIPITKRMHARWAHALSTYRPTPAPAPERQRADQFIGNLTWCQRHQQWRRQQWRLERQARVRQEVERDRLKESNHGAI